MFRFHWRGPSRIATDTKHAKAGRLQWVLPKVAKSLESLYTSPRWLLRRWRWKLGLEVSIHVITSKFSEILGSTTYYSKLCYVMLYYILYYIITVIPIWSSVLEWKDGTVQHSIKDPPRTWLHKTLSELSQNLLKALQEILLQSKYTETKMLNVEDVTIQYTTTGH